MSQQTIQEASIRLQQEYIATTVTVNRWSPRKGFTVFQKLQAVQPFGAQQKAVSASKRLINPRHPKVKAVNALCNQIRNFWEGSTHPYVEKDKRLLKAAAADSFTESVNTMASDLLIAVLAMQESREEILSEAREHLQELFNASDYPANFQDEYSVIVARPSITPPEYLKIVNPVEYQQRLEQFQLQMQQTVLLAEQTLADELATLVHNLADRLGVGENGQPKVFRTGTLSQLQQFFNRFSEFRIREGTEIDAVVQQAQELLNGHSAGDLREPGFLRSRVQEGMRQIEEQLAPLITSRARRRLGVRLEASQVIEEPATMAEPASV